MSKRISLSRIRSLVGGTAVLLLAAACASQPEPPPPQAAPEAVPSAPAAQAPAPAAPAATRTAPAASAGSDIPLNPRHPTRYVVKKGDTLWDISAMFLKDPWYWPEIWYVNPQVANPHLIYPGDVLALVYIDGRPQIILERGGAVRLSPRVRREPLAEAIPTIPYDRIAAFLGRPRIVDRDTAENAPYILTDRREHLVHASGTEVYIRGDEFDQEILYNILSIGDELADPDNGDVLGYEAIWVGEGSVVRNGDPATLFITASSREATNGDKVLPVDEDFPLFFTPRVPEQQVDGSIISVIDGVSAIGTYDVVAMNRGSGDGLAPGHILSVWQSGRVVKDRFEGGKVTLPDEYAGMLMVFRTFEDMSYGIIFRSSSEIRVLDKVRNP